MTLSAVGEQNANELFQGLREVDEIERARTHPGELLRHTKGIDAKTGEYFEFHTGCSWTNSLGERIVGDEDHPWFWQREEVLNGWVERDKTVILKARQLGITWLAGGYALWLALFRPGTRILCVSINEAEASKLINRIWDMFLGLPEHFTRHVKVVKPAHGHRPYDQLWLEHPDGKISAILGLPSTKKAGHGETAALVILDEAARQEYARETWKAVIPTMAGGGKVFVISTANGVSNDLTGEGNFFHHLWVHEEEYGLLPVFLGWRKHPDRDDAWFAREAMAMPAKDRAEQFPSTPHEAFILTGDLYFDAEALDWYDKHGQGKPLYRMEFAATPRKAKVDRKSAGCISVYREPQADHEYAISADVATGRGLDYSCAYVIDLSDMTLCAELHAKIDYDLYATQLHYLGRWFNTARMAVETGGGYGDGVIIFLRDGKEGRPPYPKLYRHRQAARADLQENKPFGFPMNAKTRPLVLEYLERSLRDHNLPFVTPSLLSELSTFTHAKTNPSPRAQDGCNDDRVMAAAIAVEMFRQYGTHPNRAKRKGRKAKPIYPWQEY